MNRFWEKMITIVPPFGGSDQEASGNVQSHKWRVVRWTDVYPEANDDWMPVVACSACGVKADTEASKYPCGTAPKPVSLRDWKHRRR